MRSNLYLYFFLFVLIFGFHVRVMKCQNNGKNESVSFLLFRIFRIKSGNTSFFVVYCVVPVLLYIIVVGTCIHICDLVCVCFRRVTSSQVLALPFPL